MEAATATGNESCNYGYNWDSLNVGNVEADTSQFFFVGHHPEHERFIPNNNQLDIDEAIEAENEEHFIENPEQAIADDIQQLKISPRVPLQSKSLIDNKKVELGTAAVASQSTESTAAAGAIVTAKATATRENKSTSKTSQGPAVYKFTEIYDAKKKARMEEIREREKKQRQFHSHPAPNFRAIHAAVERKKQQLSPQITCPVTPAVLRRHKETQERIKKMREEYQDSQRPKPFVSNPDPDVLRKRPFVPQPVDKPTTTVQPFNLQTSSRLKERQKYDENYKSELERKIKEKEEQERHDEERLRKEMRKATTFKAQPNPFK